MLVLLSPDQARPEVLGQHTGDQAPLWQQPSFSSDTGEWALSGRVGGCVITGNEDSTEHCAMNILLLSLPHLGFAKSRPRPDSCSSSARPDPVRATLESASASPQRLHQPQHDVLGLEPDASGADAQGRRRDPRARKPEEPVGCRMSLRLRQPRLPLSMMQASDPASDGDSSSSKLASPKRRTWPRLYGAGEVPPLRTQGAGP